MSAVPLYSSTYVQVVLACKSGWSYKSGWRYKSGWSKTIVRAPTTWPALHEPMPCAILLQMFRKASSAQIVRNPKVGPSVDIHFLAGQVQPQRS